MRVQNGGGNGTVAIRDIQGDMGEPTRLDLVREEDGDVIICIRNSETGESLEIQFCTHQGGGRNPRFTEKLGELVALCEKQAGL